jgi:phage shock protein PspC (stress-responsive transcriptional regulator)
MPATTPPAGPDRPDDQPPSPGVGSSSDAGPTPDAGSQLRTELRSLRRARDGRLLGGVCAGLGPRLQIDPVLLRVVGVVLALFGGVGVLLYAAGWLLMPAEGEDRSILEQQLGRRRNGAPDNAVVVGGLVVLGLVVFSVPWWGFPWHVPVLLVLSVLGLIALIRRNAEQDGGSTPSGQPAEPGGPGGSPPHGVPGSTASPGAPSDASGPMPSAAPRSGPARATWPDTKPLDVTPGTSAPTSTGAVDAPTGSWRTAEPAPASFWDQPDPLGLEIQDVELAQPPENWTPPPATSPRPVTPAGVGESGGRKRSWLFAGTMAAAFLLVMMLAVADQDEAVPVAAYVAGPLGVVGLGLIVGTWFGRTRALIASGVLLALALPVASMADRWTGDAVDLTVRPTSVSGIQDSYDHGVGQLVIDLSAVPFRDRQHIETSIDLGVGDVFVVVPSNVDVIVNGDVGLGELALFGRTLQTEPTPPSPPRAPDAPRAPRAPTDRDVGNERGGVGERDAREVERERSDGVGVSRRVVDHGDDGPGGGELVLNVDVGVGHVEVQRAN